MDKFIQGMGIYAIVIVIISIIIFLAWVASLFAILKIRDKMYKLEKQNNNLINELNSCCRNLGEITYHLRNLDKENNTDEKANKYKSKTDIQEKK